MPVCSLDETTAAKLKRAVGCRCELCREYVPLNMLSIHVVPQIFSGESSDPQKRLLILCLECHQHVRELPVTPERQKEWVEMRPFHTKMMLRKILGYSPSPYIPPDDTDLAALYQEMNSPGSPAMFRWAG